MTAAHNWIGKLGVKIQSAKSWRCDAADQNFLCLDVDTIYGYYQSRFGSLGPSYKGVPMPLKAQNFYTSHSGWVQIKFIFVAYEMSNTFLDHMQLDLGRYHLPFGRYSLKYLSRNSRFWPFKPISGPWQPRKRLSGNPENG